MNWDYSGRDARLKSVATYQGHTALPPLAIPKPFVVVVVVTVAWNFVSRGERVS